MKTNKQAAALCFFGGHAVLWTFFIHQTRSAALSVLHSAFECKTFKTATSRLKMCLQEKSLQSHQSSRCLFWRTHVWNGSWRLITGLNTVWGLCMLSDNQQGFVGRLLGPRLLLLSAPRLLQCPPFPCLASLCPHLSNSFLSVTPICCSGPMDSTSLTIRARVALSSSSRPKSWRRSGWSSLEWPCKFGTPSQQVLFHSRSQMVPMGGTKWKDVPLKPSAQRATFYEHTNRRETWKNRP